MVSSMSNDSTQQIRTFKDAVALITGGASGIGAALAKDLVRRGATVILADRQFEAAQELANTLGDKAEAVTLDVRDADQFADVIRTARDRHGRIDYFFNNAGIGIGGPVEAHGLDDWRYTIDVNILGVVYGVHAMLPIMRKQGFGHIVNTASMAGQVPCPGLTAYATTKHAVVGLTRSLRAEYAGTGVAVSAFCPGVIRTEILNKGGAFGRGMGWANESPEPDELAKTRPMEADAFARAALDRVAANDEIIILPRRWYMIARLDKLFPRFASAMVARGFARESARLEKRAANATAGK